MKERRDFGTRPVDDPDPFRIVLTLMVAAALIVGAVAHVAWHP